MCSTGRRVSRRETPKTSPLCADVERALLWLLTSVSREIWSKTFVKGAQEDATDFMIRVGTSVSNLDKDWQGQLLQAELESLQYEVSLNGV